MARKAIILMADYGHDPTETAVPFSRWTAAGLEVNFATEHGAVPKCDTKMLYGLTQKLLGATRSVVHQYKSMEKSDAMRKPLSWNDPSFSLDEYDVVFLPGGHDKGMRQIIDSAPLHAHLASYVPKTERDAGQAKALVAICHGVMVLARTQIPGTQKSVLHEMKTTALPGLMERSIFWATRLFLGDYYKTYGAGSENVEDTVKAVLDNPAKQWCGNNGTGPFVVEDEKYNYVSGRFPPDAELLADKTLKLVGAV